MILLKNYQIIQKKIKDLYYYLTSQESDDFDLMKKEIIDKLFIEGYIFILFMILFMMMIQMKKF